MYNARLHQGIASALAVLAMAGCATPPPPEPCIEPAPPAAAASPAPVEAEMPFTEQTPIVRAYRRDGASHLYKVYADRIYKGKIPPLVYAVVVVETQLDAGGRVTKVSFSRTPSHAPEVAPMIARMIEAASPLPAPDGGIGAHTYVDTWLWDKSGHFQIDTLTLGQITGTDAIRMAARSRPQEIKQALSRSRPDPGSVR